MATKSKKSTQSQPHDDQDSSSTFRPTSPLTPTRLSRIQEKQRLQELNDRFVRYIEAIRSGDKDNQIQQSSIYKETLVKEVSKVKSLYDAEMEEVRKALDQTSNERAKLQLAVGKVKADNDVLNQKYTKKEKEVIAAEKRIQALEDNVESLKNRLSQAESLKKKSDDNAKSLENDIKDLNKQIETLRNQLESESLARVALENKNQTLMERLQFEQNVHHEELQQSRVEYERQITESLGEQIREEYEERIADELRELREENEQQLNINRQELIAKFNAQVNDLKEKYERRQNSENVMRQENQVLKSKVEILQSKAAQFESLNKGLTDRVKELETLIEQEREWHDNKIKQKDDELKQQLLEYQDLLDTKVAIDMEINAYKKLLEGEEARLSLSTSRIASPRPQNYTSPRPNKRKRYVYEEEENFYTTDNNSDAKGDVEIIEHDAEGKFVKLLNKGDKDISLGGWQLKRIAGEQVTIFKFHRSITIKPKAHVTVWSANSNATHNPPADIVMKGQTWFAGEEMQTILSDDNKVEMATRTTSKKIRKSFRSSQQRRELNGQDLEGQERCSLM